MFDLKWIQDRVSKEDYYFSRHGDKEMQNDNITVLEVDEAILNGMKLDQYDDTGRG